MFKPVFVNNHLNQHKILLTKRQLHITYCILKKLLCSNYENKDWVDNRLFPTAHDIDHYNQLEKAGYKSNLVSSEFRLEIISTCLYES